MACHVGLTLSAPTVGVAKSRFYGSEEGENITGSNGELLGKIVEAGRKKLFVSVGNLISLDEAVQIVRKSIVGNHCVPLREAHLGAARLRRTG